MSEEERVRELVVESLQLQVEHEMIDVDEPLFGGDVTVDFMGSLEIIAALEHGV